LFIGTARTNNSSDNTSKEDTVMNADCFGPKTLQNPYEWVFPIAGNVVLHSCVNRPEAKSVVGNEDTSLQTREGSYQRSHMKFLNPSTFYFAVRF